MADAVWTRAPLVPVIVSGYVPAGVLDAVLTESVELPVAGLKLPLDPAGNPVTFHETLPLKPLTGATVTA